MSRSGYIDDCDEDWQIHLYRGRVASATRGKRGQKFFVDLLAALDSMPVKRLVADDLENARGEVCALGSLGKARGIEMHGLDPEDAYRVGETFDIAECLAREVVYVNDEASPYKYRLAPCRECHGWGETVRVPKATWFRAHYSTRGPYAASCIPCYGSGRERVYIDETPEERFARMRKWAASNIKPASA